MVAEKGVRCVDGTNVMNLFKRSHLSSQGRNIALGRVLDIRVSKMQTTNAH